MFYFTNKISEIMIMIYSDMFFNILTNFLFTNKFYKFAA